MGPHSGQDHTLFMMSDPTSEFTADNQSEAIKFRKQFQGFDTKDLPQLGLIM